MSEFEFYMNVLKSLEEIGARYMVVGAFVTFVSSW